MAEIHFGALDLNLLRIFDALLEEQSVTRAGARLGLSQSAVSHALNRLRHALGDELFVRSHGAMRPTARAREIGPAVHAALGGLQSALAPGAFEPATARRRFTIGAGAYGCAVLMPFVIARVAAEAPLVQVRIVNPVGRVIEQLDSGEADVVITGAIAAAKRFAYERLFDETMVWAVRPGHPAAGRPIRFEELCAIPHVVIALPQASYERAAGEANFAAQALHAGEEEFEEQIAGLGLTRNVAAIVPDTFSALAMAMRSDLAALMPRRLAEMPAQAGRLALLETPYVSSPREIGLLRRRDRMADPAMDWLVCLLLETARRLDG